MKKKSLNILIIFVALTTSTLYASNFVANDTIILHSLLKTIEVDYNRSTHPWGWKSKPIYWITLTDVDLNKNEWRFAYIETDRKNTFIVKDFKTDTIIDNEYFLLFISYNNMIFKNKVSNDIKIDSLIFSEEPMHDPSHVGSIIIHSNYCRIKYSCGGKYNLLRQSVPYKLPPLLNCFALQALQNSYKYAETEKWSYIYSEQNEKTKAKLDEIIEDAAIKRLNQEDFIKKLVKNCNLIWVNTWKRKLK